MSTNINLGEVKKIIYTKKLIYKYINIILGTTSTNAMSFSMIHPSNPI
jgi:hypothetical protein